MAGDVVRGLYGIADVSGAPNRTELEVADALLAAGVTVLQLRMKGASAEAVRGVLRELVPRARAAGCALVLNDQPDLAAEFEGVGVHLGQHDTSPVRARELLGPNVLIGWSTHSLEHVREASELPVDYIGFGPVFSSAGKHLAPSDERAPMDAVGLAALSQVVAAATVPVVAIGGIDAASLPAVMQTGVAGAAVISAVSRAEDCHRAAQELAAAARQHGANA